jgi:hypothetical protein
MPGGKRQGFDVNRIGGRGLDQVMTIHHDQPIYRSNAIAILKSRQKAGKDEFSLSLDDVIHAPGTKNFHGHKLRMGPPHDHRSAESSHPAGDGERFGGPGRVGRNTHHVGLPDIAVIQTFAVNGQIPHDNVVARLFNACGNIEQTEGWQTQSKGIKNTGGWRVYQ